MNGDPTRAPVLQETWKRASWIHAAACAKGRTLESRSDSWSHTKAMIPTQCVQTGKATGQHITSPSYHAGVLLKVNLKLGGANLHLPKDGGLSLLRDEPTMVMGFDVNHPQVSMQRPHLQTSRCVYPIPLSMRWLQLQSSGCVCPTPCAHKASVRARVWTAGLEEALLRRPRRLHGRRVLQVCAAPSYRAAPPVGHTPTHCQHACLPALTHPPVPILRLRTSPPPHYWLVDAVDGHCVLCRYHTAIGAQKSRTEITNLVDKVRSCLRAYTTFNGTHPRRVLFYRDGVAHNQFDTVLESEVGEIYEACKLEGGVRGGRGSIRPLLGCSPSCPGPCPRTQALARMPRPSHACPGPRTHA